MEELPQFSEIVEHLSIAGAMARASNQRLSFHPGPFNILASNNPKVVTSTIKELNDHSKIFNYMGLPEDHWSKINIHVGAAYGDHKSAMERWCRNFDRLENHTQSRLTVENDDRPNLYSTKMLYDGIHKVTGTPIVFDSHHFACGHQDSSYEEAIDMAVSSWPKGIRPTCHHSNSRKNYEDPTVPKNAHSDWYYEPFENCKHSVDVVLECKKKQEALFRYLSEWGDYYKENAA
jgi:UV DNA damage endonuclease